MSCRSMPKPGTTLHQLLSGSCHYSAVIAESIGDSRRNGNGHCAARVLTGRADRSSLMLLLNLRKSCETFKNWPQDYLGFNRESSSMILIGGLWVGTMV